MLFHSFLLSLFMIPGLALHAGQGEFDPDRDVQIVFSDSTVTLTAPSMCHLKGRFLAVTLASGSGALRTGPLPTSQDLDESGDPIYHGEVRIPISGTGLSGTVTLAVQYQPCTEGARGVCFLPLTRRLEVAAADIAAGGANAAFPAALPTDVAEIQEISGRPFSLAAFQGNVLLLDFWASWCGPCQKSFPALEGLHRKFAAQGLSVVGVSLDEDYQSVVRFLVNLPVDFNIALDPFGKLARQFRVAVMPTSIVFDRTGREVARFEGGERIKEEEATILTLLAGKPLPPGAGAIAASGLRATGSFKAWNRGHLADSIMNLDGNPLSKALWEHIHSSKEGAAGNGGAAGGGCGCN